jgi:hypothetical protein
MPAKAGFEGSARLFNRFPGLEELHMKKVVFASLLAVASVSATSIHAQTAVNINQSAQAQAGGGVQMSQPEYNAYNNAISQTDPAAKAAALEAYLTSYPQSSVKASVLELLMGSYAQANNGPKALDAADRLLQVAPSNLRALAIETSLLKSQGDQATDPATKQAAYDKAAGFAQRGLSATKPADMADADFNTLKTQATPYFYSAVGIAAITKKDYPAAISAYESELKSVPAETTKQPSPFLQDTYFLAQAYYQSTPPDLLKCTFYATRTATFAPDQFKASFQPLATYCYKKYHGGEDGYDAVKTAAAANVFFPSDLAVKPAPTPQDFVNQVLASTPDLSTLALSDREFIITNGKPEDAEKVFAPVKGKEVRVSGTVVSATDTAVTLAVSDDAKQAQPPVADFTFNLKEPLKTAPTVGSTLELVGTFDSYTQKPLMIVMSNAEGVAKAPTKAAPARRTPARRR